MSAVPAIDVEALRDLLQSPQPPYLLDVREGWENDLCQIPGATLMPMATIPENIGKLPTDRMLVVHCHHGGRSARVVAWLHSQGLTQAVNLAGGIHAWSEKIDPSVKTYG